MYYTDLLDHVEQSAHDPAALGTLVAQWRHHVRNSGASEVSELCGIAAVHPLPWVRQATSQELYRREFRNDILLDLALWLCHDFDDYVAFDALDFLGLRGSQEHLRDMYSIIGLASERLFTTAGKPVGIGHAVALRAIQRIVGSNDRAAYQQIEKSLFRGFDETVYTNIPCPSGRFASHSHQGMVWVEGGVVRTGLPSTLASKPTMFDWSESAGDFEVSGFYLDINPVTVAEYRRFAMSESATQHSSCHVNEPHGKVHGHNTMLDARSGAGHPVTGVDWFDAYAYASWCGKVLPTEYEWQRGALGDSDAAYPWGDEFSDGATHGYRGIVIDDWESLLQWRGSLLDLYDNSPGRTTVAVNALTNVSEFGARGMSGNVWEWTNSSWLGGKFNPQTTRADALDVVYDQTSYAVIKGGAWTSPPEQLSPRFRGRDLAFDRHFEIGFRCACSCKGQANAK